MRKYSHTNNSQGHFMIRALLYFTVFSLTLSHSVLASQYNILKKRSGIRFSVDFLSFIPMKGHFNHFTGHFNYNKEDKEFSNIAITIRPDSIHTGDNFRDKHLKGPDFFNSAKYDSIVFKANKIIRLRRGKYIANGKLKIKETEQDASVSFSIREDQESDNIKIHFKSQVDRSLYKIATKEMLKNHHYVLSKNVMISGAIESTISN
jgi:polyisoprenoid-binding protein YceI